MSRHTRIWIVSSLVAILAVYACHDSASPPTGPTDHGRPTFDIEPTGGCVPEAEITREEETETILVNFTVPDEWCTPDGSSYGIGFGDGDANTFPGNTVWSAESDSTKAVNLLSPVHYATAVYSPQVAYLEFDPPVRSVDFMYATMWAQENPFKVSAYSRSADGQFGFLLDQVEIHVNNGGFPFSVWDPVQLSYSQDLIAWVVIESILYIDDLQIIRDIPPASVECSPVTRGNTTTCTVSGSGIDSVTSWRFDGISQDSARLLTVVDDTSHALSWSGTAALSGTISVEVYRHGIDTPEIVTGPLTVDDRLWRWPKDTFDHYAEGSGPACLPFLPHRYNSPTVLGQNNSLGDPQGQGDENCGDVAILPNVNVYPDSGYTLSQVPGTGPNAGFLYVASASHHARHGSILNPDLDSLGIREPLTTQKDNNACSAVNLPVPGEANWWEFNKLCQGWDLYNGLNMIEGLRAHEGYGTPAGELNGHQSRFEWKAGQTDGDPWFNIESLVDDAAHELPLRFAIGTRLSAVNTALFDFMAVEPANPSNWCGVEYVYDLTQEKYQRVRHPQNVACP